MKLREHYEKQFREILNSLNASQKKAVDTIEGPVLVIAGPGTGKTQILAARIANILVQTDCLPENILCLTYTDAGTIAMRKRLVSFMGPDAYRIGIHTFHSFCNMVIQENLDVFGFRNLEPIDELEQITVLHGIIDDLPKNHPLKRYTGEEYFEAGRMKALFETMKREDWTAEYLIEKVEAYEKDLPNRDEYEYKRAGTRKDGTKYKKGDLNEDKLNAELGKMELLKAAALLLKEYDSRLAELKRYDFSDMILWVIHAFKTNPGLLATYQEKYLYMLVDEFQDTSGSQNDLLQLLISYWDEPNIFAVGDDDQSIYRFQGASVENVQAFEKQFKGKMEMISLDENYRSTQLILDASASLISRNEQRVLPDKQFLAKGPNAALQNPRPTIYACINPVHEAAFVGGKILELQQAGTPLSEIAVLYRNHSQADMLIQFLKHKGVGINTRKRENVLLQPVIRKIIGLMRYLSAETKKPHSGEHFLFEILHYDEFRIPLSELAELAVKVAKENFEERRTSWRDEIAKLAQRRAESLFEPVKDVKAWKHFSKLIQELIEAVHNVTVQELIQDIINRCGFLTEALGKSDQSWQMELINTFFGFVKASCARKPSHTLHSLTAMLDLMIEQEISLPAERVYYSENGVNLITAHSSKGLEFDVVFILGANSSRWDSQRNSGKYKMPDNLVTSTENDFEEARRLFYVAITRARKQLLVCWQQQDLKGKELEASLFVEELKESGKVKEELIRLDEAALGDFLEEVYREEKEALPANLLDTPYIESLLEKYTLSVTHLNAYLHCPLSFYFNNFIKVPAAKSGPLTFGSAVHYALEMLFKKMNENPERQFHDSTQLLRDFAWFMRKHQDSFMPEAFKRKMEYGEKILSDFYTKYISFWNKVTSIERSYRNVVVGGVPMNGKLDKLEFDGKKVNVVDYKTGNYKKALKKFGRPDEAKVEEAIAKGKEPAFEDLYGGDYWRQAVFYKLLMDNDPTKDWEMESAEFDFVEPDQQDGHFHKEKVTILPGDLEIVKRQVIEVYKKIKAREFTQGCGKEDCEWCNFTSDWIKGKDLLMSPKGKPEEESDNEQD
ncbi:MAG: ATP-dependent helicase [Bacteroidia bacterium]|nr:ATP-dependent helicase [Bacteroidia bacterium]